MLPRKFFESLHAVMAILVSFGKLCLIFRQIVFKYFDPSSECSPNMMHFVCTFLITHA